MPLKSAAVPTASYAASSIVSLTTLRRMKRRRARSKREGRLVVDGTPTTRVLRVLMRLTPTTTFGLGSEGTMLRYDGQYNRSWGSLKGCRMVGR